MDANLTRVFQIREQHRIDLRFEFFNLLNHTTFNNPGDEPAFGDVWLDSERE